MSKITYFCDENNIEESAKEQIDAMLQVPSLVKAAIMPDVHAGYGVPIGTVLELDNAVMPSAVGVDIGCGMLAVRTTIDSNDLRPHFDTIVRTIKSSIPMGFSRRNDSDFCMVMAYAPDRNDLGLTTEEEMQLGTLGGGNHFIEILVGGDNCVWLLIHSGSRNYGYTIGHKYMQVAAMCDNEAPNQDLATLNLDGFSGAKYWLLMENAQRFAKLNRHVMMEIIKSVLMQWFGTNSFVETIDCHHNYAELRISPEAVTVIHRKGAIAAHSGDIGIIPGSMGSPSYIVEGLGNPESLFSASHGAGRTMSRSKAKKTIGIDEFRDSMSDVYSENIDEKHLDEAPLAYKDIRDVMAQQKDNVKIIHELTPVLNIKG